MSAENVKADTYVEADYEDAMVEDFIDEDKSEEKYDGMTRLDYDKEPDKIKAAIQNDVDEMTAEMDEPTKQAIQEAANETLDAIDDVRDTENYFVAEPKTWGDFGHKHLNEIHEALQELKKLSRQSVEQVKEGIESRVTDARTATMEKAADAVAAFKAGTQFLHHEQDRIEEENLAMRKALDQMATNMNYLEKLAKAQQDEELMEKVTASRGYLQSMAKDFGRIYDVSAKKENPKYIPSHAKMCIDKAKQALIATSFALSTYTSMAKAAVKEGATRIKAETRSFLHSVMNKVKSATHQASAYMKKVSNTFNKAVVKGRDFVMDLPNYRMTLIATTFHKGKEQSSSAALTEKLLPALAKEYVKEAAENGMTKKDIRESGKEFAAQIATAFDKECGRYTVNKKLKLNEAALAR